MRYFRTYLQGSVVVPNTTAPIGLIVYREFEDSYEVFVEASMDIGHVLTIFRHAWGSREPGGWYEVDSRTGEEKPENANKRHLPLHDRAVMRNLVYGLEKMQLGVM